MKGKEIITHSVRAEMPDMEQLKKNSIRQAKEKTVIKRAALAKYLLPAASLVCIIAAVLAYPGLNNRFTGNHKNPDAQIDRTHSGDNNPAASGIHIPAIELPKSTSGLSTDMLGLFVYQGRIYTQSAWYYNEEADAVKNLIGDRVGYATGTIDEWSEQEDYSVELAGSVAGDIYTVNGYDPAFRLCMTGSYTDDNGALVEWINFYENLNNITLETGADLFGDRLMLRENRNQVKTQTHDNWNAPVSPPVFNDLTDVTDDDIDAFINTLYDSAFEYVYETVGENFYFSESQAHLYFEMNDRSTVELRLFEGGYVGYQHLGWHFVKMPGSSFDVIFNACLGL
jgi:hypothetical protein